MRGSKESTGSKEASFTARRSSTRRTSMNRDAAMLLKAAASTLEERDRLLEQAATKPGGVAALLSFLLAAGSALACVEACFVVSLAFAQRARQLLLAALVRLAALEQDDGTSTESDMRP